MESAGPDTPGSALKGGSGGGALHNNGDCPPFPRGVGGGDGGGGGAAAVGPDDDMAWRPASAGDGGSGEPARPSGAAAERRSAGLSAPSSPGGGGGGCGGEGDAAADASMEDDDDDGPYEDAEDEEDDDEDGMADGDSEPDDASPQRRFDFSGLPPGLAAMLGLGPPPPVPVGHCTNCTAPLFDEDGAEPCPDCGRAPDRDGDLFAGGSEAELPAPAPGPLPAPPAAPLPAAPPPASLPTVIAWDERMLAHEEVNGRPSASSPHPERPDRLRACLAALGRSGLAARCVRLAPRHATDAELLAVHSAELVETVGRASRAAAEQAARDAAAAAEQHAAAVAAADAAGGPRPPRPPAAAKPRSIPFSADTYVSPATDDAARLSAGAAVDVAVAVATGRAASGFALVRPPGHHCESGTAMGFCLLNHAAVAAAAARAAGASRVLVFDWDVHYGNGTAQIFEDDPDVLYASIHRWDGGGFYPGSGSPRVVGTGRGAGATVNVGWLGPGAGDADYAAAMAHVILPIAAEFAPDLVLLSAGFDAAEGDPIGGCAVTPACFAAMAHALTGIAPVAAVLEGGYNLEATAAGVAATAHVLLGGRPWPRPDADTMRAGASPAATAAIRATGAAHAPYWACMACFAPPPPPPTHAAAAPPFEGGGGWADAGAGVCRRLEDGEDDGPHPHHSPTADDERMAGWPGAHHEGGGRGAITVGVPPFLGGDPATGRAPAGFGRGGAPPASPPPLLASPPPLGVVEVASPPGRAVAAALGGGGPAPVVVAPSPRVRLPPSPRQPPITAAALDRALARALLVAAGGAGGAGGRSARRLKAMQAQHLLAARARVRARAAATARAAAVAAAGGSEVGVEASPSPAMSEGEQEEEEEVEEEEEDGEEAPAGE